MGLDTSHDAWHGPYSSFMQWRIWLAGQIGIDLKKMEGFTDNGEGISFDVVTHDIKPLLNHSDCDGELTVEECKQVLRGLKKILKNVHASEMLLPYGNAYYTNRFIAGCERAIKANEPIDFH